MKNFFSFFKKEPQEQVFSNESAKKAYRELAKLLLHGSDEQGLSIRIDDVFADSRNVEPENFSFELAREYDEENNVDYPGRLFFTLDWKVDVAEAVWQITRILGDEAKSIEFPKEEDFTKDIDYTSNVLSACGKVMAQHGYVLGSVISYADCGLYFITIAEYKSRVEELLTLAHAGPSFP